MKSSTYPLLLAATAGILLQSLTVSAAGQCATKTLDECQTDCGCNRVACCCGSGCNQSPGSSEVVFTLCVDAGSNPDSWNCPSADSCGVAGLIRTVGPCSQTKPNTTAPTDNPMTGSPNGLMHVFGTTFPMVGTQQVPKQTWHQNVYMGTNLQFNEGAFWQYTDSFYAPHVHYPGESGHDDHDHAPTPAPQSHVGQVCYGYLLPCPAGYYCKSDMGFNPQQKGTCQTDPNYNAGNPWNTWNNNGNNWNTWNTWNPNYPNGQGPNYPNGNGGNQPPNTNVPNNNWFTGGAQNSCAPPSVCGFQAVNGQCWCDNECHNTGDCCTDIATHCQNQYNPSYPPVVPPPANNGGGGGGVSTCPVPHQGDCTGKCNLGQAVVHAGGKCFCDPTCLQYNDCCCNFKTVC